MLSINSFNKNFEVQFLFKKTKNFIYFYLALINVKSTYGSLDNFFFQCEKKNLNTIA